MRAIISDIHGNLEAYEAVLADIADRGITRIACLGDVVGYGPDPLACLERTLALARAGTIDRLVVGNHERALLDGPWGFNPTAAEAIRWTSEQLAGPWYAPGRRALLRWLREWPTQATVDGALLVHGSPREPTDEYLLPREGLPGLLGEVSPTLRANLERLDEDGLCFAGHTHVPGVFDDAGFVAPMDGSTVFPVGRGRRIVNVGSVGQPRDGDPRACYVVWEGERVYYHRVAYDVAATAAKIRAVPELHDRLADRLEVAS